MNQPAAHDTTRGVNGSKVVVVFIVAVVLIVGYFVLGMPGMDHGGDTAGMSAMDMSEMALGVDDFEARLTDADAFVVNVHVLDEGRIAGTDAAIRFDRIVGDARLPNDKASPLLLYCKTGRMSADAATALMNDGYTNVVYLEGGMDAWVAAGRSLE